MTDATESVAATEKLTTTPQFNKVKDSRGREIDGLWERNGRYYAQIYVANKKGCRRFPLLDPDNQPVRNAKAAQDAMVLLRQRRDEGETPVSRRAPFFPEFSKHYITWLEETEAKSMLTIRKEESSLKGWAEFLGHVRVSQITRATINSYVLQRKKDVKDGGDGVSNRTVNLDIIALSNCLGFAKDEGWIKGKLPTDDWKALDYTAPERPLRTREEIDALCTEALRKKDNGVPVYASGEQFADWVRLMQWSGARHTAALSARWEHVDFENRRVKFYTKYSKIVTVNFNDMLEAHLKDMLKRRVPDCPYLFPSPRSDGQNGYMTRMYKTTEKIKAAVVAKFPALADFTPHDLRHFFISWAVMNGIDTMTIADWVGHSDGGVLIGKVYGHLDPRHKQKASAVKKLDTESQAS
jgi:integrase